MASSTLSLVRNVFKSLTESKGFDRLVQNATVVAADKGKCELEMTVDESHLNRIGYLHGGMTAMLVDTVSTMAIACSDSHPGVSVDMNISYMNSAKAGDVLRIKSECIKTGKNLAFATVDISKKDDDKLIATGRQTKFVNF